MFLLLFHPMLLQISSNSFLSASLVIPQESLNFFHAMLFPCFKLCRNETVLIPLEWYNFLCLFKYIYVRLHRIITIAGKMLSYIIATPFLIRFSKIIVLFLSHEILMYLSIQWSEYSSKAHLLAPFHESKVASFAWTTFIWEPNGLMHLNSFSILILKFG